MNVVHLLPMPLSVPAHEALATAPLIAGASAVMVYALESLTIKVLRLLLSVVFLRSAPPAIVLLAAGGRDIILQSYSKKRPVAE